MNRSARVFGFLAPVTLASAIWLSFSTTCPASPRHGADPMLEPYTASLLVDYFETFLKDRDIEAFQRNVMTRYREGTLERLAKANTTQPRRAAMLALGLIGTMKVNETVARGLRDPDVAVRNLAQSALWAIWYRADSPENNAALQQVRDLIGRERYADAIEQADRLIARAPGFAEAYNQRAIAYYSREMFAESALDCRRVLERNPYHVGALGGLAQCYMHLNRRRDALATFRRSLKLQPFNESLRETVEMMEAEVD